MDRKSSSFKNKALYIQYLEGKVKSRKNTFTIMIFIVAFTLIIYFTIDITFVGVTPYTMIISQIDEASNNTQIHYVYVNQTGNLSSWNNGTSEIDKIEECNEDSDLLKGLKTFLDSVFNEKNTWLYSLLVFLGIIYLIQVGASIIGDIIELVLVIIVASKRLIQSIIRKVKPQKDPVYSALIQMKGGTKNNDKKI